MLDNDLMFVKVERDNYKLLYEHWEQMYKNLKAECENTIKNYDKELTRKVERESNSPLCTDVNEKNKELMLAVDEWYRAFLQARDQHLQVVKDCKALAKKLLEESPKHESWLIQNFQEYL